MLANKETLNIPFDKDDIEFLHIALVSEGACMELVSYQVDYTVCPSIISQLAKFNQTHSPAEATQHEKVKSSHQIPHIFSSIYGSGFFF